MLSEKQASKLYKILKPEITKYLRKYNKFVDSDKIKELTNDIYIKIYQNFDKLPKDKSEISKYIYITCKNHALNYKKIKKIDIKYIDNEEFLDSICEYNNNIEDDYIFNDQFNYESSKMNELEHQIFNYKYMGYNLNEISRLTHTPKTNIYRNFNKIKKINYDNFKKN